LYLVRQILESAEGKITVNSTLGKGSVFSVFLKKSQKMRRNCPLPGADIACVSAMQAYMSKKAAAKISRDVTPIL